MDTPPAAGQPSSTAVLVGLAACLDSLTDPATAPLDDLGRALVAVTEVIGRLEAAQTRLLDGFAVRGGPALDGARSGSSWLSARSELSATTARQIEHRGRGLRTCPHVATAYAAGRLGTAKVRLLLAARDGLEERFTTDEEHLVGWLSPLTVRHAAIALARWRELAHSELAASPDDPAPDPEADNSLTIRTSFEGRRVITGTLDPLTGAELQAILDAEVDAGFRTGRFSSHDGLTAGQRRAIAHLDLLRRGATTLGAGSPSQRNISVIVHVDIAALLGLPITTTSALLAQRCELDDGTPVPLSRVLETSADATINTILGHLGLDGRFHPVGEITNNRLASARQRRLLNCRDRTCTFPGCDQPANWTEAHHVETWQGTHKTSVPRLALLCRFHHHSVVHADNGITYTADTEGTPTVSRADGQVVPTPPFGHKQPLTSAPPKRRPASRAGPTIRPPTRAPSDPAALGIDGWEDGERLAPRAARCLRHYRRLVATLIAEAG